MKNTNGNAVSRTRSNSVGRRVGAGAAGSGDRQRPVLAATVPAQLKARVEREAQRRGSPTLSAAVESLLEEALAASDEGRRGDIATAQLQRINLRLATLEGELRTRDALIVELVTTLTKTFLAHTPPPAEQDRDAFKRSAAERFARLMDGVQQRIGAGDSSSNGLMSATPTLIDEPSGPSNGMVGQDGAAALKKENYRT